MNCEDCGQHHRCGDVLGEYGLHGADCQYWNHRTYHCPERHKP